MLRRDSTKGMFRTNLSSSSNKDSDLIRKNKALYNSVGKQVDAILQSFKTGDSKLQSLLAYDKYAELSRILLSYKRPYTTNDELIFEFYRKTIVNAIEAAQRSITRQNEQTHKFDTLQSQYDTITNKNTRAFEFITITETIKTKAAINPEICEYVKRGYKLVDEDGSLIPIDMDVLAKIRSELAIILHTY